MFPVRASGLVWLATALAVTVSMISPTAAAPTCRVSDFGARGDGRQYETRAIQAAVDSCAQPGQAGTVVFDEGRAYLTATIILTGSVHVYLPSNSTLLLGIQVDAADFVRKAATQLQRAGTTALISADGATSQVYV